MNKLTYITFWGICMSIVLLFSCCSISEKEKADANQEIAELYEKGLFAQAQQKIKLLKNGQPTEETYCFADSIEDYINRYQKEYPYTQRQIVSLLTEEGIVADADDLSQWEQNHQLQYILIDEEKRYFKSALRNLLLLNDSLREISGAVGLNDKSLTDFCLTHMYGDCGMQTLLFMTLCRYKGIPARWQSGWMLHPGNVNLHDWCEVWYNGIGWVPVDVSFKLQDSDDMNIKEFYISGIDSYRLIVNTDYGRELHPKKKFPRSEPWDFQRGEMEWQKGNLYFDVWKRSIDVEYNKH